MSFEIKKNKVSFQRNTWESISQEMSVIDSLNLIKSDYFKKEIESLRSALSKGDKESYNRNKLRLPAVTFCGTFNNKRLKENLKEYNYLIVIDIDKLTVQQMDVVGKILVDDPFVFSYWRSPSNRGFKGLIQLDFSNPINDLEVDKNHKYAFKKLTEYFKDNYDVELDKSGSDITRLCFLSYDAGLVIKKRFELFKIDNTLVEQKRLTKKNGSVKIKLSSNRDALYNPQNRNSPYDRKIMSSLIRYLNNKNISITDSYENWYKIAMAISNTFTFEVGLGYFIKLSKRDSNKFNQTTCNNFLINCYEHRKGEITLATIIFLANNKGFKTKYQKNGVPKVEG